MKTIYIGESIAIENPQGASVIIGDDLTTLYKNEDAPENVGIETDEFTEGNYSIVVFLNKKFISTTPLKIKNPLTKQDKRISIRQQIDDIDMLIHARLTSNEDAIQQMTINNKTLVYEGLESLISLRKHLVKILGDLNRAEKARVGKSPIITYKARFTR